MHAIYITITITITTAIRIKCHSWNPDYESLTAMQYLSLVLCLANASADLQLTLPTYPSISPIYLAYPPYLTSLTSLA
jgi:hypothetical protein